MAFGTLMEYWRGGSNNGMVDIVFGGITGRRFYSGYFERQVSKREKRERSRGKDSRAKKQLQLLQQQLYPLARCS